jgi:hypothetical protein
MTESPSSESLTPLEKARQKTRELRASGVILRKNPLEKAAAKPTSLRLAISAKCYECVGQDSDPGWHGRIRDCLCPTCPLYPVRPYQQRAGVDDEEDPEEAGEGDLGVQKGSEPCPEEPPSNS